MYIKEVNTLNFKHFYKSYEDEPNNLYAMKGKTK